MESDEEADDPKDECRVTEEIDKPQLHPREAQNMSDQLVEMVGLEEEDRQAAINDIIQKIAFFLLG